jgi:RNA-binding motif X-linked protein 2
VCSVVREIDRINQAELELGNGTASWHDDYKDSAYIFIGGLHYDLTEGDVITIFSQCVFLAAGRGMLFIHHL